MAAAACKFIVRFLMSFSTTKLLRRNPRAQLSSDWQIRHLLDLIRRATPFSSRPAPPTKLPCYERFPRSSRGLLRPWDAVPPASPDGRSRCRVAELRAESKSKAWGTQLSRKPKKKELQEG